MFGVEVADLHGRSSQGALSLARRAIWHVLIEDAGYGYAQAARALGKRHPAALLGYRKSCAQLREDPVYFDTVEHIRKQAQ